MASSRARQQLAGRLLAARRRGDTHQLTAGDAWSLGLCSATGRADARALRHAARRWAGRTERPCSADRWTVDTPGSCRGARRRGPRSGSTASSSETVVSMVSRHIATATGPPNGPRGGRRARRRRPLPASRGVREYLGHGDRVEQVDVGEEGRRAEHRPGAGHRRAGGTKGRDGGTPRSVNSRMISEPRSSGPPATTIVARAVADLRRPSRGSPAGSARRRAARRRTPRGGRSERAGVRRRPAAVAHPPGREVAGEDCCCPSGPNGDASG